MFDKRPKNIWQQIVGPLDGEGDVLEINQQGYISLLDTDKENEVEYKLYNPTNWVYLMVIEVEASINGNQLMARDAVGVSLSGGESASVFVNKESKLLAIEVPGL
jgi:quercetin 2,3-dioxygenase